MIASRRAASVVFAIASAVLGAVGCGNDVVLGGPGGDSVPVPPTGTLTQATKVDLLLVVDNSPGTGDAQKVFAPAFIELVDRLVEPPCSDGVQETAQRSVNGVCPPGLRPAVVTVPDLHVGILTSSLGGRGADDACGALAADTTNDRGHLLTRGAISPDVTASGFVAIGAGASSPGEGEANLSAILANVTEAGCQLPAPLEAFYRFLSQPDPYVSVAPATDGTASYVGVDRDLLAQRRAFLRPDSLVVVVVLTNKNDASIDPMSAGGRGWSYAAPKFPDSPDGPAPRATTACDRNPFDSACLTCDASAPCDQGDTICGEKKIDANCTQYDGFYLASEDPFALRFFHPKARFGVDPLYPVRRYVNGLSSAKVPSRRGEHVGSPIVLGSDYAGTNDCDNALFAAEVPDPNADQCHLTPGPRSAELVMLSILGGAPPSLVVPGSTPSYSALIGTEPTRYDFDGIDPRMVESNSRRANVPGDAIEDPTGTQIVDWDTGGVALEFACTWLLPAPKDCTIAANFPGCWCDRATDPKICDPRAPQFQVRGTATPSARAFQLARDVGPRATALSSCPNTAPGTDEASATYGYRGQLRVVADSIAGAIAPSQP